MVLEIVANNPTVAMGGAVGLGAFLGVSAYKQYKSNKETDKIDSEGFEEKFKAIFRDPAKTQGSVINDIVKIRGDSSTPRTIGLAHKAKKMDVDIVKDRSGKSYDIEKSEGTVYQVIEGSNKYVLKLKKILSGMGLTYFLETYDVPNKLITAGEDYIWLNPESHFIKYNGVKRHLDVEGLSRGWETSFSKILENYLEAMGDIPEQFATLNNRINGQLKIENQKSQNFREFEEMKKDIEKLDAVE